MRRAGLVAAGPAFAGVSLLGVKDGATVASPVHLDFAVEGMAVKPAAAVRRGHAAQALCRLIGTPVPVR